MPQKHNLSIVEMYLENATFPQEYRNLLTVDGQALLINALPEILQKSLKSENDIKNLTKIFQKALFLGHFHIAKFFIKNGVDINAATENGATPLLIACNNGRFEIVEYLVENGAKVNVAMENGAAPLLIACNNGRFEIVEYLVEKGAKVNAAMENGASPFLISCNNGNLKILQLLLLADKSSIDIASKSGSTPLYLASQNGHLKIVKYLIENGADHNKSMYETFTPLMAAAITGKKDVVEYFLSLPQVDLQYITKKSDKKTAEEFCLKNGIKLGDNEKYTDKSAVDLAKMEGHEEVAKMIEQAIKEKGDIALGKFAANVKRLDFSSESGQSTTIQKIMSDEFKNSDMARFC